MKKQYDFIVANLDDLERIAAIRPIRVVIYARISSAGQKEKPDMGICGQTQKMEKKSEGISH